MLSPGRVAVVTLGLALCGAVMGAVCATIAVSLALITHSPHEFLSGFAPPPLLLAAGLAGAAMGAVSAPILAFGILRRVPLGRAIVLTALGTIAGAVVGEMVAPVNPYAAGWTPGIVRGALLGFVMAGVILRLTVRRPGPSAPLDAAV